MRLAECNKCEHGSEVDGKSYCGNENVYSYLSNCIQKKALEYYLKTNQENGDQTVTHH